MIIFRDSQLAYRQIAVFVCSFIVRLGYGKFGKWAECREIRKRADSQIHVRVVSAVCGCTWVEVEGVEGTDGAMPNG